MKVQDAHRSHDWEIAYTNRDCTYGFIEYERRWNCNVRRVLQFPLGLILDSDPKPVPKYCPVALDR